jgi:hypothetical protein
MILIEYAISSHVINEFLVRGSRYFIIDED